MESWVASAIGMSVSALAVGLVYLFLHRQYHHTFLRTWAIGWALYGLAVVFEVRLTHRYDSSYLLLANQAALLGSAVMLLLGVVASWLFSKVEDRYSGEREAIDAGGR